MIKIVVIHGEVLPCKSFSSISQPTTAPAITEETTAIPMVKLSAKTSNKNLKALSFFSFNLHTFKT
jgi:hypothetical protein